MKILLIYPGMIVREVPLNILYISSSLKKAGFNTKIFEFTPYQKTKIYRKSNKHIQKEFEKVLLKYQPDIVGISLMTVNYNISMLLLKIVKEKTKAKVICGGIQPTIEPDETINEKYVDFICIGEGEKSFTELVTKIKNNDDYKSIDGIWIKEKNKIYKNPVRKLEKNIDDIPFPDREALPDEYYNDEIIDWGVNILTSRGCPYHCSFCQNKYLMETYKEKGPFVRYRSFENIFEEIEFLIKRYNVKKLYFSDETFTLNKKRILEFLKEYEKRYKIPFICQTRIDKLDEDIISSLKDAGCYHLSLAIESGNDEIRNKLLKKPYTNNQIKNIFDLAKKYSLKTQSFNIIGLPGENINNIFETINLNKELQPDRILCTIYMPFKGTELGEWCYEQNLVIIDPKTNNNYYNVISIKYSNIDPKTIIGYQGFFDWYIRLPKKYYKLIDVLRIIYQTTLTSKNSNNRILNYFRIALIEFVYKSKKYLPVSNEYYISRR